jgi:oligopeptide transport system ATP-binding protein
LSVPDEPLLSVQGLRVEYRVAQRGRAATLRAVDDVSFDVGVGETLGIVGESGSGKSSLARALLRLVPHAGGQAHFRGQDLLRLPDRELQRVRRQLQMIFQDPLASLDPRMTVADIIGEPLRVYEPRLTGATREARVFEMMQAVGLLPEHLRRFPHEFSGGQAQRIGIARALILRPALVVCDEPISALDVSIKSQIANLLRDLQAQMQLALLFIAHDLAAIRFSCDRILVLYLGRVMEIAPRDVLFDRAGHPYTRALLAAAPVPDPTRARARAHRSPPLAGEIPSPLSPPSGCVFRTRCPWVIERCALEVPALREVGGSLTACHRAEEVSRQPRSD